VPERVAVPLDPGVRLVAARRGPASPIGPPVRRVAADDPPADPWHRWFGALSGGGREVPVTDRTGVGTGRDGYVDVEGQRDHLLSLHLDAVRPAAAPDVGAGLAGSSADRSGGAVGGAVGWLRGLAGRAEGWTGGAGTTRPDLDPPSGRDEVDEEQLAAEAAAWWGRLRANDPVVVRQRLEQALADAGFGAAVAGVDGDAVGLLLGAAGPDVLVGRWGRDADAQLGRLSVPERHDLHARTIRSATVALAREALAVAPGLGRAACAVVQADHPRGRPAVLAVVGVDRTEAQRGFEAVSLAGTGRLAPLDRPDLDGVLDLD
jgi:hypothetical protein